MSKYHSQKVAYGNEKFDSVKEFRRWRELCLLEQAGKISNLKRQVSYELIPTIREPATIGPRGGVKQGRVIESAVRYVADFVYTMDGRDVVEDTKGVRTADYIIKRKLMLYIHGVRVLET